MTTGDIIILVAYAIGLLLTAYFQGKKIDSLKTQVNSQSGVIENMQRFMSIFKLDEIEKYVEINRKRFEAEKEDAVKQAEVEKERTIKQVEAEIKAKATESIHVLRREQEALLDLAIRLLNLGPTDARAREYIVQIGDDVISKKHLLSIYDKNQDIWREIGDQFQKSMMKYGEQLQSIIKPLDVFWERYSLFSYIFGDTKDDPEKKKKT